MQSKIHIRTLPALPATFTLLFVVAAVFVAATEPARAQPRPQAQAGALFPEPFVAEHRLIQTDGDGSRFETEPVTDYYGGSWIVSVRPDGSRVIVDLARREITEVRPDKGTYSTLGFDRMADLARRIARAERRGGGAPGEGAGAARPEGGGIAERATTPQPSELLVEELGDSPDLATRSAGEASRPGVRRLRVRTTSEAEDPEAGVEVWLDPSVRLRPAALDALASFEAALAGGASGATATRAGGAGEPVPVGRYVDRARRHAGGAMAVRTVRTLAGESAGGGAAPASARVRLEDVTSRLEPLADFPEELVAVPEGLQRVPHPLEGIARFLEDERERDRAMSGAGRPE